jgi:hypothetical protein
MNSQANEEAYLSCLFISFVDPKAQVTNPASSDGKGIVMKQTFQPAKYIVFYQLV